MEASQQLKGTPKSLEASTTGRLSRSAASGRLGRNMNNTAQVLNLPKKVQCHARQQITAQLKIVLKCEIRFALCASGEL